MIRPLLLAAALAACSRATPPPTQANHPAPTASAFEPSAEFTRAREARRRERVMQRASNVSRFTSSDQGAADVALEYARAASAGDPARLRLALDELRPDDARVELGLTFDGARALRERILPAASGALDAITARLAALHAPLTTRVHSALGQELAQGPQAGMDPRVSALAPQLRPAVRFYRIEVLGADGAQVILEPVAYLGARWTWLGTALADAPPVAPPTAPPGGMTGAR